MFGLEDFVACSVAFTCFEMFVFVEVILIEIFMLRFVVLLNRWLFAAKVQILRPFRPLYLQLTITKALF